MRCYSSRVRTLIGRAIEVAQWGQTDTHVKKMNGPLRETYEIVVEGARVTYRAVYYVTKQPDGPIAVLDVFVKKSTRGNSTPAPIERRIVRRLQRIKEVERE